MKQCPNCNQYFEDDNSFCTEDGTPLIPVFGVGASRTVISIEDERQPEILTQVVPAFTPPAPAQPNFRKETTKGFYITVGALVAVIFSLAITYIVLRNSAGEETAASSNKTERKKENSSSGEQDTEDDSETENVQVKPSKANTANKMANAANTMANAANAMIENTMTGDNRSLGRNFNRTFSGTADSDGISMRLQRSGSSLGGRVFSRRSVTEISVSGTIDDDGYFEMSEYSDIGANTGVYRGRITPDGAMSGTWTKPDGSKPRSFYMRAN